MSYIVRKIISSSFRKVLKVGSENQYMPPPRAKKGSGGGGGYPTLYQSKMKLKKQGHVIYHWKDNFTIFLERQKHTPVHTYTHKHTHIHTHTHTHTNTQGERNAFPYIHRHTVENIDSFRSAITGHDHH